MTSIEDAIIEIDGAIYRVVDITMAVDEFDEADVNIRAVKVPKFTPEQVELINDYTTRLASAVLASGLYEDAPKMTLYSELLRRIEQAQANYLK